MPMNLLNKLIGLIYPCKCVFCDRVLKSGDICLDCERKLPYTRGDSIVQKLPFVDKCVSPLYYKDDVRLSVHRYKFRGCAAYSRRYGELMSACVENNLDCGRIDVISWIPLSRQRLRTRGYDQARLIAEEMSRRLGIACVPTLKKIRNNKAQSLSRDAKQRRENVSGVYAVADGVQLEGKRVLLVDDVVTTGSTLSEGARMLRRAGAKAVSAATLARHED